jgi:prevent-host-death family protein
MTRLTVSKAKAEFSEVVNRAAKTKERTVVSRRGKGIAAVVPIEDLRLLEHLTREEMDRQDIEDARKAGTASRCASLSANSVTDFGISGRVVTRCAKGDAKARSAHSETNQLGLAAAGKRSTPGGCGEVTDEVLLVLIVGVGDRKEVYRRLK